jgi:hypothetical protein
MRKLTRAECVELEKKFLGSLLAEDDKDLRRLTSEYSASWRDFVDKKHRALWRVMETLDLLTYTERVDILLDEAYADPPPANPMLNAPGDNLVAGEEGSAARRQYYERLAREASSFGWLVRELDRNGQLFMVGGKQYLQEVRDAYTALLDWDESMGAAELPTPEKVREDTAKRLGFIKK